jgi:hypothetical protein
VASCRKVTAQWHSSTPGIQPGSLNLELGEVRARRTITSDSVDKCIRDFDLNPAGTHSLKGEGPLAGEDRADAAEERDDSKLAQPREGRQSLRGMRYKSGTNRDVNGLALPSCGRGSWTARWSRRGLRRRLSPHGVGDVATSSASGAESSI